MCELPKVELSKLYMESISAANDHLRKKHEDHTSLLAEVRLPIYNHQLIKQSKFANSPFKEQNNKFAPFLPWKAEKGSRADSEDKPSASPASSEDCDCRGEQQAASGNERQSHGRERPG